MPFQSIEGAKRGNFPTKAEGIPLTLAQINKLASIHDAIKRAGTAKNPMAVAWTQWKEIYVKEGDKWVRRKKAESEIRADIKQFLSLAGELALEDKDRDFFRVSDAAHRLINDILENFEIPRDVKIQMINSIIDEIPGILREKVMSVIMSAVRDGNLEIFKEFSHLTEIKDMAVFKVGTHNGDKYDDGAVDALITNFNHLKDSIRPKLKITHKETQETLAGLASYGDITRVFMKVIDGIKHIYVDIANVPQVVADWVKNRRFPERSVEIYPKINIDGKNFFNVLRNVSLLGCEPPAVPGLEPIKLDDNDIEYDVCIMNFDRGKNLGKGGDEDMPEDLKKTFEATIAKLKSEIEAKDTEIAKMTEAKNEAAVVKLQEAKTELQGHVTKLESDIKVFQEQAEKGKKAEEDLKKFKEDKKASFISNAIEDWKTKGQIVPAEENGLKSLMETLSDEEVITCTVADGDNATKEVKKSALQMFKESVDNRNKKVDFQELSGNGEGGILPPVSKLQIKDSEGKIMPVDGEDIDIKARKYMKEHECSYEEAVFAISPDQKAD